MYYIYHHYIFTLDFPWLDLSGLFSLTLGKAYGGETVNGPMLKAKQLKFKEQFDVPKVECLSGDGWIAPFCKAYGDNPNTSQTLE
jgi:hypothetical protein